MQIVIKLSERDYRMACEYPDALIAVYAHAIKNGVPLPKGHGRLVDAEQVVIIDDYYGQNLYFEAPTIVEADKEGNEE